MSDDLLTTVKTLLREHSDREGDKCPCGVCDAVLSEDQQLVADWLRALVARVEQAEAEVERMKLVVMAHKTWENEAVAQAGNANLALNKIRTENAALREQRCETCRYESDGWLVCRHLQLSCDTMGNRCGAWARREP